MLIPLSTAHLATLEWFAGWTPSVHQQDWLSRRAWPPGYREMVDPTDHNGRDKAVARGAFPPVVEAFKLLPDLLAHRFLEGAHRAPCRLTARGRAALKLQGIPCPDLFASHCEAIFDPHDLRPTASDVDLRDLRSSGHETPDKVEDTPQVWSLMLEDFRESANQGLHTVVGPRLSMSVVTGETYLHGSLRRHHTCVQFSITDGGIRPVCEVRLSFEQLAALLTSGTPVPGTLTHFYDPNGMRQSRTAPPPVEVSRRVAARRSKEDMDIQRLLGDLISQVEEANMSRGVQRSLLASLQHLQTRLVSQGEHVTDLALDEISSVLEAAAVITNERALLANDRLLTE